MNRRNSTLSEENFMQYLKNIFDIIDSDHEGFIRLNELARHLESGTKSSENTNRPRMMRNKTEIQNSKIISALNQVSPASGLLNFQRFSLAMRIALGRASADHCRGGISRSLRPKSFLFAVTESSESESSGNGNYHDQENDNDVQNVSCSSLDGRIEQLETENQIESKPKSNNNDENSSEKRNISASEKTNLECLLERTTEQVLILKKSLHEVENLQKWHYNSISTMEERRELLENLVSLSDEMVESDRSNDVFDKDIGPIDLSQLNSNISQLMHLKENLMPLTDKNKNTGDIETLKREASCVKEDKTSEMLQKVEKQTHKIERLEAEKAALLKELFHTRAKLNTPEQSKEAVLPF